MLDLILAVPAATAPSARSSLDFVFGDRPAFPPGVSALEDLALAAHNFMLATERRRATSNAVHVEAAGDCTS